MFNWTAATALNLPANGDSTSAPTGACTSTPNEPSGSSNSSEKNGNDNSKNAVAIGAGVGIPLGIAALGFLAYLVWKEKRRKFISSSIHLSSTHSELFDSSSPSHSSEPLTKFAELADLKSGAGEAELAATSSPSYRH